jgi:hypothetical protein
MPPCQALDGKDARRFSANHRLDDHDSLPDAADDQTDGSDSVTIWMQVDCDGSMSKVAKPNIHAAARSDVRESPEEGP